MQIFKNRPFALAACIFAIAAVLLFLVSAPVKRITMAILISLLLLLLLSVWMTKKWGRAKTLAALLLIALLLSCLSSYLFFDVRYADIQEKNGQSCTAEGYVLERMGSAPYYTHLRVRLTALDCERMQCDAILETTYTSALQSGDAFRVIAIPRAFTQEEIFDEEGYRLAEGCLTVLTCDDSADCTLLPSKVSSVRVQASRLNMRLSYSLRKSIGGEAGGVAVALLLGNRTWLTDLSSLHFRRAGVSHLLALSGLHVSILIGAVELLLRRLRVPKAVRAVLLPLAALSYLTVTGFAMSTCRAVLMICALYLGFLLRAQYDSFTSMCAALVLILLVTPYAVLDLSMWMSFLAAASIIVFSPAVARQLRRLRERSNLPSLAYRGLSAFLSAVAVGIAANLSLLLLNAAVFGELSVASVPTTLLLSVPVTLLIVLSAVLLCAPFLPLLPEVCNWLGGTILKTTERVSDIPDILLPVNDPVTHTVLLALTVLLVLVAVCKLRHRGLVSVLLLSLCACVALSSLAVTHLSPRYAHELTVLQSSRGEIRIYTERGHAVVVNDVKMNTSEAYEIKTAALQARCTEVDDLILYRYYNQATYFISRLSSRIRVRRIHLPTPTNAREQAIAARLAQEAELYGITVVYDAASLASRYP